jgi:hypothetical protein
MRSGDHLADQGRLGHGYIDGQARDTARHQPPTIRGGACRQCDRGDADDRLAGAHRPANRKTGSTNRRISRAASAANVARPAARGRIGEFHARRRKITARTKDCYRYPGQGEAEGTERWSSPTFIKLVTMKRPAPGDRQSLYWLMS